METVVYHGSLFSGIGGFDLAAETVGWKNVFQVENDPFCLKVLEKNFPDVQRFKDIFDFDGTEFKTVTVISGGFPCQPFSFAGRQRGTSDGRYLWPEMFRVIRQAKPSVITGENVNGIISLDDGKTFERICSDLENQGYIVESFIIPAIGVGAWHKRERIFFIGYLSERLNGYQINSDADGARFQTPRTEQQTTGIIKHRSDISDADGDGLQRHKSEPQTSRNFKRCDAKADRKNDSFKPGMGRLADGVSYWMDEPRIDRLTEGTKDRVNRIKSLGNAVVPQVAEAIFREIDQLLKLHFK